MSFPKEFVATFGDLYEEYCYVKKAVILAENFMGKIYTAPLNQLRSALDHAFKAVATGDETKIGHELNEFREHVRRAGYDSFEFLTAVLIKDVIKQLNAFSNETITTVFPDYYQVIRPSIQRVKLDVSELRAEKNHDKKPFVGYIEKIAVLIEAIDQINATIPFLQEYEDRKKREEKKSMSIDFKKGLGAGLIIAVFTTIMGLVFSPNKKETTPSSHEVPKTIQPAKIAEDSTKTDSI